MTIELDPLYREQARLIASEVAATLARKGGAIVPEYVNPTNASLITGIPERTLENYRKPGATGGPRFTRVGRLVRYRITDIHTWMDGGAK